MAQRSIGRRPRRRGIFAALALSAVAVGCVLLGGQAWLNSSGGAAWAAGRMAQLLGMNTTIGGLSVAFLPALRVEATDIVVQDGALRAEAARISARAALGTILGGRLLLDDISAEGVHIAIGDDLTQAQRSVAAIVSGRDDGTWGRAPLHIALGAITVTNADITMDGDPWARVTVTANDLLSPSGRVAVSGVFGPDDAAGAELKAELTLAPAAGVWTLGGTADFSGNPAALLPRDSAPAEHLDLSATFQGALPDSLHAAVKGEFKSAEQLKSGDVSADVYWKDGLLSVNDLVFASPEFALRADATLYPGQSLAYQIYDAKAARGTLDILAAQVASDAFGIAFSEQASVSAQQVHGAYPLDGGAQQWDSGTLAFEGISVLPGAEADWPPLESLAGALRLDANSIVIDELTGAGLRLSGRVTPGADGAFTAELSGAIDLAKAPLPQTGAFAILREASGGVELNPLRIARAAGDVATVKVALTAVLNRASVSAVTPGADAAISTGALNGTVTYADGEVKLSALRGEGLALDGTVSLPAEDRGASFDLAGQVNLGHPLVAIAAADLPLSRLSGTLQLERASGVLPAGGGAPADLVLAGRIDNGGFQLALESPLQVSGLSGTFATEAGQVTSDITAVAANYGDLAWRGTYNIAGGELEGSAAINAANFAPGDGPAASVLAAYGDSIIDIDATLPAAGRDGRIEFARQGSPPLTGLVTLVEQDGRRVPGEIRVDTELPLDTVTLGDYPQLSATGSAAVRFTKAPGATEYAADVNLDAAAIAYGDSVRKAPGQQARVQITGGVTDWSPQSASVTVLGESVLLRWSDGGVAAENLDLEIGALAPLFAGGMQPQGHISGRFQSQPLSADLSLENVTVALSPELRVDALNGGLRYDAAGWRFDQLRVQALDSDFTLDAGLRDGRWQGNLSGTRLNLNRLIEARAAYAALAGNGSGGAATASENAPAMQGELGLNIASVQYRKGELRDVSGSLIIARASFELADLRARVGAGLAEGSVLYTPKRGSAEAQADVNLTLQQADARVLDGLAFPEPRGLAGAVDAVIDMRLPLPEGQPPQNGMSGTLRFTATNGTYGQMGFATKILSVLRTTEVLRLNLPSLLRDEGLVFDSSNGAFQADNGRMEVQAFDITSKSYAIAGRGWLDFPRDDSNVQMSMYLFEAVTGVVGRIPLVGEVVDRFKQNAAMNFVVTGSPYAPDVKVVSDRPAERIDQGVRGAIKELRGLGDALGL
jgi:hypothetical protein